MLNIYILTARSRHVIEDDKGFDGNFFLFLFILLVGIIYFQYAKRFSLLFNQFSISSRFSKNSLLEAYLYLGAHLIKQDTADAGKKIVFMNDYFNRHFPDQNYNFSAELSDSYQQTIPHKKIAKWLLVHLDKPQRLQVLYFSVGFAILDGIIVPEERKTLSEIAENLEISPKEFQSILGMYQQQRKSRYKKTEYVPQKTKLKLACKILGVSEHAAMDEVKKAYRKLVKLHHPDRFFNESQEQQQIAEERFLAIQKAYETIEKLK